MKRGNQIPIARPTGNVFTNKCPECGEKLLFEFTDSENTFTMGLETVLSALDILEGKGVLTFPESWKEQRRLFFGG